MTSDETPSSRRGSQDPADRDAQTYVSIEQLHRMTAVLAHELRNPLSVLQSGLELIDDETDNEHSLKKIFQIQIQQMTRLVEDLLDVSRSSDGRIRIQKQPIDLMPSVKDAIKSVEQVVTSRDQRITLHGTDQSLWLNGDPQRIVQCLTNLLSNASKYSDPGTEISITVARTSEDSLEVRVRDQGIGIDSMHLDTVFDFYSQVNTSDSLAHSDGGLGIGLGLVRTLIELHEGSVCAHSEGVGKGSEFIVRLPCCEPQSPARDQAQSAESLSPARILIVDDQPSNVYMLIALLEKLGKHELRSASDGVSALSELADFVPDIVLLDLGLPGMSGLELAKEIRRIEHCHDALLVALTGYDDDQLRADANKAGINLYRLKPVSTTLLCDILRHRQSTLA